MTIDAEGEEKSAEGEDRDEMRGRAFAGGRKKKWTSRVGIRLVRYVWLSFPPSRREGRFSGRRGTRGRK